MVRDSRKTNIVISRKVESAYHEIKGILIVTDQPKRIKADIAGQRAVEKLGAGSEGDGVGHFAVFVEKSRERCRGREGAVGSDKGRGGGGGCEEDSELHSPIEI